ncbi:MAG: H(+)/Cl(-) exchange transporter ClcA [Candidatus Hydrogenedentes bacterium]|nr:H(+)/Cl(-) exchange transporter ClcA [Candidatus Hydrogenedentota bacterium]
MSQALEQSKNLQSWHVMRDRRRNQYFRAALVGLLAGAVALLFQQALVVAETARMLTVETLHATHPGIGWVVPMLAGGLLGALAGWMTSRFAPEAAGSGIPHVKGALAHAGEMRWWRVLPVKFLGGVLAIGSGFSMGREGPTVQMGAAVGKLLADTLRVPAKAAPRLMACGAGAGLAAAFHAPLAGFIFTIEELQREFSTLTYVMALIAAVVANIVGAHFWGSGNVFDASGFPAAPLASLPICVAIGVLAGFFGSGFSRSLLLLQRYTSGPGSIPAWKRAGAVGLLVGLAAWWLPEIAGGGHEVTKLLLHGGASGVEFMGFLAVLFAGKFLLTVLCYAAGVPGGIFAPMLVMGASLGMITGIAVTGFLPDLAPIPESFVAIGMAAFFAAVVRAPITGIVLVLEMTGDFHQLLPLITASLFAMMVAERLRVPPIYDALLEADTNRRQPDVPAHREPVLLEFVVQEGSAMDGHAIKELPLPARCLFVTITRQGNDLLPNGDTVLHRGDHITAVLSGAGAGEAVARLLPLSKA